MALKAQQPIPLTNADSLIIKNYAILTSHFQPLTSNSYWAKIVIRNPYPNDEQYVLSLSQPLNYSLYQLEMNTGKWAISEAGPGVSNGKRTPIINHCTLKKYSDNTIYIKIELPDIAQTTRLIKPDIILEKEVIYSSRESFVNLSFWTCCIMLISFSCYNFYIYLQLKDKAYLYYVIAQAGALLYLTGDKFFFNVLLPVRIYHQRIVDGSVLTHYNLNDFFEHIGAAVLMCGFVNFSRFYLQTKEQMPGYDQMLRVLSYMYMLIIGLPALLNISGLYMINRTIFNSVFIMIMIIACLLTALVAYQRKIRMAKHFLLANLIPLSFIAMASFYIIWYRESSQLLPEIAILSQILTFAVALVARIKVINEELTCKALEAITMKADLDELEYQRLLAEQQRTHAAIVMEIEQEKNELLQQKLEANQRELAGSSLHLHQKTKLLSDLKTQLRYIDPKMPHDQPEILKNIKSSLNDNQYLDERWGNFKLHFEQVHPDFFKDLLANHPGFTTYEVRLYAYFHINLSTKEIATLLNIAPASVRQAKTRLLKKINQ
ncbi:7TM protein involved in diverse intracellular signaling [Pedobacter metabolipauper]|uniref:7TM protein involved in diverse intracellular signaling n=2 Tax=Pedobacter metabolipauper TaxID=425513 RepID=A0A4R6SS19_9SPHI|nr:7TM protein involved in diverse intracellular signaling [Pedobacter metabolipauper]